jgi:hydroxymethylglutaryl-CoA synthase
VKGITGYAAYLPAYRISRDAIAAAWQTRSQGGHTCAIRYDEDAITMAASAAQDCREALAERPLAGLYLASTTLPFLERSNASLLAAICDFPPECATVDFSGTLRAGTTALGVALDQVEATRGDYLVAAADTREAPPGSDEEQAFGDAGAAVTLGSENVLAELVARASISSDFFDAVRRDRDVRVVSYASKFSTERGYYQELSNVIPRVLAAAEVSPAQIDRLIVNASHPKTHLELAKRLGFRPEQMEDTGWKDIGVTGAAMPLVGLAAALEQAKPGQWLLVAAYADGADALLFRTTERVAAWRPPARLAGQRAQGIPYPSYSLYRKAREWGRAAEDTLEISNVFYAREEQQNIRLHGVRCGHCGTKQLPDTKLCVRCHKGDALEHVALARCGSVFTFAVDMLYPTPIPPTVMAVVDLEGGGRVYCEVVDVEPEKVAIGMPVEMVIRRLREGGGLHHYYWKCRPRRTP